MFKIRLLRCSGEENCASEEEIDAYINSHFLYYGFNTLGYEPNDYSSDVIVDLRVDEATGLDTTNPKGIDYTMQENILESEHYLLDLGLFPETYTFYTPVKYGSSKDTEESVFHISLFMNTDAIVHKRVVYSLWDCLSDIGGLFDSLKLLVSPILFVLEMLLGN